MRTSVVAASAVFLLVGCNKKSSLAEDASFTEPELGIEEPAAASWVDQGAIEVSGTASHLSNVKVNDVDADLSGDAFSAEVELERGMNLIEVRGTDERGDTHWERHAVLAGEFADPGVAVTDAIGLRVNEPALDFALEQVGTLIDPVTLNGSLTGLNPVYSDSYGLFGWNAVEIEADLGGLTFDQVELDADPAAGVLDVEVQLPELDVWVPARGSVIGWDFDVDVWLSAKSAEIDGRLTVDVVDGKLKADLVGATVQLHGFTYDTSLLPGEVESFILVDTIRGTLEDMLVEQVTAMVPGLLEEQLAGLDLSFETEILDKQVGISADFTEAWLDGDGLGLVADLNVNIPGEGTRPYAGYLKASGGVPHLSTNTDVSMALSDDLLNRVLFEAWRGGVLDLTMSTEDGSLDPFMLAAFHATAGSIEVEPGLPPVVVQKPGTDTLTAQLGEMLVTIDLEDGDSFNHLVAAVSVEADLDLKVRDGVLAIDLGEPQLDLVVRESDFGGASNEAVTALLLESLPIDTLLGLVGDLEFPLPSVAGITVDEADAERDDTGIHTHIRMGL